MPTIDPFLKGAGLDVSPTPSPLGRGARHAWQAPDNLYSLRGLVESESLDFVRADGVVATTKFNRLVLKEWFHACRVGGHVVIRLTEGGLEGWRALVDEVRAVLGDRVEVAVSKWEEPSRSGILVLRKSTPSLAEGDTMDRWTFGIITNGRRNTWVDEEIRSIRALGIPNCEIIVCGTFRESDGSFRYIPFTEGDDRGWITRKKNLICEAAEHENLCITHDKFLFDPGFFQGMRQYGNYFETLGCVILDTQGNRAGDWVTYGNDWDRLAKTAHLEYRDWDRHGFLIGALYILKRSVWEKVRWDERLYWGEKEDIRLAKDLWDAGVVTRFNPHARVTMRDRRFGRLPVHAFDEKKLGKRLDGGAYYWYMALGRAVKKYVLGVPTP